MATNVLAAVRRDEASRYYKSLSTHKNFKLQIVTDFKDALDVLGDRDQHTDLVVVDNHLANTDDFIAELRHSYPRLFIILVDEEADFGWPGQADEISTTPFDNDDLARRITRLMSDRQLETLRADSLPAVRDFAKRLRKATGEGGKQQAAVTACMDLDYYYVAFYRLESANPPNLTLKAQEGPQAIKAIAPKLAKADENDLLTWVAQTGQSRMTGPDDEPNYPLVRRRRLGAAACVPVDIAGNRYGVLIACREEPESIQQENVLMLELVSAQLAAAISKEIVS